MSETVSSAKQPMIYAAMAKVMAAVGAVTKAKKNVQQGYQFRGIDDVVAHVQQVMADHGVVVVPRVIEREREVMQTKSGGSMASVRLLVEHVFYAVDGSSVVCITLGEAMDSGDKASNKAMSAALKYALTETLLIPTYEVDRDTEEHSPEVGAIPARSTPPSSTTAKVAAPADDLERAKARARAAFETSPDLPTLEDSWNKLVRPLPKRDADELAPAYRARQQAIRQASGVKA